MSKSITLWKSIYSDVSTVILPKTGGGDAQFDDASVTTAVASDVASGKYFLAADGTVTKGTNTGGGGSSMLVERGTCTMTTSLLTINHTLGKKPDFVIAWNNGTSTNTQRTHAIFYDSQISTTQAMYQYYRTDAAIKKNVSNTKNSTSYVYLDSSVVTLPYYSSTYTFSGTYVGKVVSDNVGTYS